MAEKGNVIIRDPIFFYGGRVTSTTTTSVPDFGLAIQPQRAANPSSVVPSVPVALNYDASFIFTNLTTTTLSAGSSYTSGGIDALNKRGAGIWIRSDQPVSVEIQESHDNSTFARSLVYYLGEGPGRSFHGYILFPLATRYWRVIVTNLGYSAQTTFRVDRIEKWDQQTIWCSHYLATVERTSTNLSANASYTSRTYTCQNLETIGCYVFADQPGTLFYDVSFDGSTWRTIRSISVSANTGVYDEVRPPGHFMRLRYVNGATAQSSFDFTIFVKNILSE